MTARSDHETGLLDLGGLDLLGLHHQCYGEKSLPMVTDKAGKNVGF